MKQIKFSFKRFTTESQELIERLLSRTSWKDDLAQGLKTLFSGGASVVDRSFSEAEMMRLRYQLEQIEEKHALAYQSLGKKSMDHWVHQQELDEKEKKRMFGQIEAIITEKEKIVEQMLAVKESPDSSL